MIKKLFLSFCLLFTSWQSQAVSACSGKFVTPFDACWSCMFPMSLGSFQMGSSTANPDTPNPSSPIQVCPMGNFIRVGAAIGFWEPTYLVDVTREPMCMVNLGGVQLGKGHMETGHATSSKSNNQGGFYNAHWYTFPVVSWLEVITDAGCVQGGDFGVGYFSELDPTWEDDELSMILTPEASAVANLIAQLACSADSVSSTVGYPLDALFWCAGAHGSMYPLTGYIPNEVSPYKASLLLADRMAYKMHREGLVLNTIGADKAVCYAYPSPMIPKSRWRYQLVNPFSLNRCEAFGRSPFLWETGTTLPTDQRHHGYLFWRKRNCVYT